MSLRFFLCGEELITAQGGNLRLVHASFFTQYLFSSTHVYCLNLFLFAFSLYAEVLNLIHGLKLIP